jgi:regulator of cell morphogenesis and NO signaling
MVADDASLAVVFQRFGIDFCCHGDVSLEDACAQRGLDEDSVRRELQRVVDRRGTAAAPSLQARSTPEVIHHVISKHHAYLSESVPQLAFLASKVASVHGGKNPKLVELAEVVSQFARDIAVHLEEEERSLFPALLKEPADLEAVRAGLRSMFEEHVEVGRTLGRLRTLSDGFSTPPWGCRSYRALMEELDALETDTLEHVHIENHVLMPRYIAGRPDEGRG